ncbi:MAG: hypothetical protein KatS3mg031_0507 [Chitinophagales bacterium]|nr:MAG: hypothetical protein KatS3mg031_0507 [Chitinophagales bacterium]
MALQVGQSVYAQELQGSPDDSLSVNKGETPDRRRHSVGRAVWMSAVLPGLGQAYNRKWWKIPIIYAGFAGLGYAISFNAKRWNTYREAYRLRVDGDTTTIDAFVNIYSESNLVTLKNYYKRNLDLSVIFTAVLYALNIIDAAVDAHLFEFDISDDLTLRIAPAHHFSQNGNEHFTGFTLTLRL